MTYRQLQQVLKEYKAIGVTNIKLTSSKVTLQAEYDRIQNLPEKTFNCDIPESKLESVKIVNNSEPKKEIIDSGKKYLCTVSPRQINIVRQQNKGKNVKYDRGNLNSTLVTAAMLSNLYQKTQYVGVNVNGYYIIDEIDLEIGYLAQYYQIEENKIYLIEAEAIAA